MHRALSLFETLPSPRLTHLLPRARHENGGIVAKEQLTRTNEVSLYLGSLDTCSLRLGALRGNHAALSEAPATHALRAASQAAVKSPVKRSRIAFGIKINNNHYSF